MIISTNKLFTNENNIFLLLFVGLYIIGWFVANDSFIFHRDEMWYTAYSTAFEEVDTKDIRHILPIDIHQVAFLPMFRYIQGFFISIFGENIFGLRFINLFFGVILIFFSSKLLLKLNVKKILIVLFVIFMLTETQIIGLSHKVRPDFIVGVLGLLAVVNILNFLVDKKIFYLYISSIFSVLASSMYWNGISILFSFSFIVLYFYIKQYIIKKDIFKLVCFTLVIFFFFLFLPIYLNLDAFIATFTNEGLMNNSGAFHIFNMLIMIKGALIGGRYQYLLFLLSIIYIVSLFIVVFNDRESKNKEIILLIISFYIGLLFILSFRSSSARHLYMFLPVFYFGLIININFLIYKIEKMGYLFLIISMLSGFIFSIHSAKYVYSNVGQEENYRKFSSKIKEIITDSNSLVLTTYDMMWTIDNPKFYLENFIFRIPNNQNEFNKIMKEYDIKYMIIDEVNKSRLINSPAKYAWYKYWNNYLKENYKLKSVIYNKYYRQNKRKKYLDKRGYINEVWEKVLNEK